MANEKRLIDASALDEKMEILKVRFKAQGRDAVAEDYNFVQTVLLTAPTVDAVEVVHGRWEDFCRGKMCCCSVCKAEFDNTCNEIHGEWHYCPNCGADMRGDGDG